MKKRELTYKASKVNTRKDHLLKKNNYKRLLILVKNFIKK